MERTEYAAHRTLELSALCTDCAALDAIRHLMSGTDWNAATLDAIAHIVRRTGRTIKDLA